MQLLATQMPYLMQQAALQWLRTRNTKHGVTHERDRHDRGRCESKREFEGSDVNVQLGSSVFD